MSIVRVPRFGFTILLILGMAASVFGQAARNGTSAASQLLIPQGARYLSGGGAVATSEGLDAVYWNPAGLSRSPSRVDAVFSRRLYIADIDVNFFGVGVNLPRFGSVAVTGRTFDIGEIPVTTVFSPDGTGEKFTPSVFVVGATYSRLLTDRTSVGVTVNYLNESFKRVGTTGVTFDAGVQYASFLNVPGLTIGVALKNFGTPMQYQGSGLWVQANVTGSNRKTDWYQVEAASFDVPFVMNIGATYTLSMGANSLDLGATFENNHFAQDELRLMGTFNVSDFVSLRGAFVSSEQALVEDDPETAVDESQFELTNIFAGLSLGGSLNLKTLTGVNLSIDYAFIQTKFFEDNQVIALRLGF